MLESHGLTVACHQAVIRGLLGIVIVTQFAPGAALAPFVRGFEIVETQDEAVTRTLLPDTTVVLGFRYAGAATLLDDDASSGRVLPDAVVTGLRVSVRRMHTAAHSGIVLAKFRAAGAASFFTGPLHHLFGTMRALSELMDAADVAAASRRIAGATTHAERLTIVEQFLLARQRPFEPDPIVSGALRAIGAAAGAIRVGMLARDLQVSEDTLEKRFRRIVGASPKQFATLVRLRRAVDLSRESDSLTTLALDAGYYDQSHFIRDFRAITGDAPGHFFGTTTYC